MKTGSSQGGSKRRHPWVGTALWVLTGPLPTPTHNLNLNKSLSLEVGRVVCTQGSSLLANDCGRKSDGRLARRCSLWGWLSLREAGRHGCRGWART